MDFRSCFTVTALLNVLMRQKTPATNLKHNPECESSKRDQGVSLFTRFLPHMQLFTMGDFKAFFL